jgi:hypothetical protein
MSRNSRYLNGTGSLDLSGAKSLSIRWIEQTWIIASLESVDHS